MIKIITAMNNPKINDELKNEKNIELSIENLNDIKEVKRLKKEDITDILNQNQKLKFTYDIGHELVDKKEAKIEQNILIERINNIHIHTHIEQQDHYPLTKNKKDKDFLINFQIILLYFVGRYIFINFLNYFS